MNATDGVIADWEAVFAVTDRDRAVLLDLLLALSMALCQPRLEHLVIAAAVRARRRRGTGGGIVGRTARRALTPAARAIAA